MPDKARRAKALSDKANAAGCKAKAQDWSFKVNAKKLALRPRARPRPRCNITGWSGNF